MKLDLILNGVDDQVLRENFYRIQSALNENEILNPDFKFIEVDVSEPSLSYPIPHGLKYTPTDVIFLSCIGDNNFYFRYDQFDQTNIYVASRGKVRLRFLVGQFIQKGRRPTAESKLPFVAPNLTSGASSLGGSGSDGWAFIQDAHYTQSSPLFIPANTRTKIPNNAAGSLTNYTNAPASASSWWDATHSTFWPNKNGDFYSFRINCIVVPSVNNKNVTLDYTIGTPNLPWTHTRLLAGGAGVAARFSETTLGPIGPSAFSNGIAFYLTSECDVSVYGINLTVVRDFKA